MCICCSLLSTFAFSFAILFSYYSVFMYYLNMRLETRLLYRTGYTYIQLCMADIYPVLVNIAILKLFTSLDLPLQSS